MSGGRTAACMPALDRTLANASRRSDHDSFSPGHHEQTAISVRAGHAAAILQPLTMAARVQDHEA
jgi:hypothetical protein